MGGVFFGDLRNDSFDPEGSPNLVVGIVDPTGKKLVCPFAPSTTRAFVGSDHIHQGNRQLGVMDI